MSITRKLAKLILTLLTLPLLVVVWLLKWFVTFLHCCSAWIFYLLGSVLLATAVLSFLYRKDRLRRSFELKMPAGRRATQIDDLGIKKDKNLPH